MKKILLLIIVSCFLGACATGGVDKDEQITQDWTVEKLYNEAHSELNSKNYNRAIKLYNILQARYPYGKFAQQAQLDTAYAYYSDEEQENALATLDSFVQAYPRHPNMDYVMYLRGLILFNEDKSFVGKLAAQDWSDRDPKANREAYYAFAQLLQNYPDSTYAEDVRKRMTKIVEALGGHEIAVARYYMQRGAFLAAVNRAQNVIKEYRNTSFVEESLALMMTAYEKMDQQQLAQDTRRILEANYPQSEFLKTGWKNNYVTPWWRYWK